MKKSRVDRWADRAKDHPVVSVFVVFFAIAVGVGTFTDALDKVFSFHKKYLKPTEQRHELTNTPSPTNRSHKVESPTPAPSPAYGFYFQPTKNPTNADGSKNYEIGFENLTAQPLLNFQFTIYFRQPIESVVYDFQRSTAYATGGDGLSADKTTFHWLGNQIMEDGGWVVFVIKTKNSPEIRKISTKLLGRDVHSGQLLPPDPEGLKQQTGE